MNDEDTQWWNAMIATAAQSVTRKPKFRGYVEHSDVQNQLWAWTLSHTTKIEKYRESNDDEGFERIIGFVLYDEANIYARKEKAQAMGYNVADEFFYAKGTIEDLLGAMFDRDSWLNPPAGDGDERSTKALSEGNGWLATLADLSLAYGRLEEKDRQVLALAFKHDVSKVKLAEMWQLSRKGVDHRIDAAIKRLWSGLGGPKWLAPEERERPRGTIGNRKAISNSHARAISDSQYEVGA